MSEHAQPAKNDAPTPYDPDDPDEAEFLGIPFRPTVECRWCPPGCRSCEPDDCECYTHQDNPDRASVTPPVETADYDALAKVLHDNGTCDVMFAHYGPAKKCERLARALVSAGVGRRVTTEHEIDAPLTALIEQHAGHGFAGHMRARGDGCPVYVAAVALDDALRAARVIPPASGAE